MFEDKEDGLAGTFMMLLKYPKESDYVFPRHRFS